MFAPWEKGRRKHSPEADGPNNSTLKFRNGHSSFCVSGSQTSTGATCTESWRHKRREEALFSRNMN